MARFARGFLLGVVIGGAYGLFTTQKTGAQRIQAASHYFADIAAAGNDLKNSIADVKTALMHLTTEVQTTGKQTADELNTSIESFNFTTEPRIKQIQATVNDLQADLGNVKP